MTRFTIILLAEIDRLLDANPDNRKLLKAREALQNGDTVKGYRLFKEANTNAVH